MGPADVGDGSRYSHRVAWVLTNGPIPDGLMVCHRCDNPPCGDPSHLFLGTNDDNLADMDSKGRRRQHVGAAPWKAKLTEAQVVEILGRPDESLTVLGAEYGVDRTTIWHIRIGRTWRHVRVPPPSRPTD